MRRRRHEARPREHAVLRQDARERQAQSRGDLALGALPGEVDLVEDGEDAGARLPERRLGVEDRAAHIGAGDDGVLVCRDGGVVAVGAGAD